MGSLLWSLTGGPPAVLLISPRADRVPSRGVREGRPRGIESGHRGFRRRLFLQKNFRRKNPTMAKASIALTELAEKGPDIDLATCSNSRPKSHRHRRRGPVRRLPRGARTQTSDYCKLLADLSFIHHAAGSNPLASRAGSSGRSFGATSAPKVVAAIRAREFGWEKTKMKTSFRALHINLGAVPSSTSGGRSV